MKRVLITTLFLALVASLYGQSVSELARLEKARREALKGNRAKVITNADLAAVRKTPAVVVVTPESPEDNPSGLSGQDSASGLSQGSGDAGGPVVMVPTVAKNGPSLFGKDASEDQASPGNSRDMESRLRATEELIDLLTTKMNALMQEANNLDTMTPKDAIQKQIDETNQKLLKVQDEAARLKGLIEAGKKTPQDKR
jgi:hypothetical protein